MEQGTAQVTSDRVVPAHAQSSSLRRSGVLCTLAKMERWQPDLECFFHIESKHFIVCSRDVHRAATLVLSSSEGGWARLAGGLGLRAAILDMTSASVSGGGIQNHHVIC